MVDVAGIVSEVESLFGNLSPEEQKVVAALEQLSKFDAKGAYEAVKTKNAMGILQGLDGILSIAGMFFPPAATADEYVRVAEEFEPAAEMFFKLYKAGVIRGIRPGDPAYNAPAGNGLSI